MTQSITLNLPDGFYQPIHRIAQQMHEPVENVLLRALQVSLPSLEGLPQNTLEELTSLENLDDTSLRRLLLETLAVKQQQELETLLLAQQERDLLSAEKQQLGKLQEQANMVMLRKARAAVLLRFRGNALPSLDDLRRLTTNDEQ